MNSGAGKLSRIVVALALSMLAACATYRSVGPDPGRPAARLPIEEHPAQGGGDTFVVLYSGDGGSSGGNRQISNDLAARGVPVVDIDSLAYFWRERTEGGMATDLTAVIEHYASKWGRQRVVLAGYSFGGSAIPVLAGDLPQAERARVRSVVMIAPRDYVELLLEPHSWINIRPRHARPIVPALRALAWTRLVCVYGEHDGLAACPRLPAGLTENHRMTGGHTFGHDYAQVAAVLEAEAK
jgi:type IV secretory pathway VirJ component